MPRCRRNVTSTEKNTTRLPDWSAAGVSLLLDLIRRDQLDDLAERLQIRREGGYAGIDVFVFLLYYFASRLPTGLKGFWYRAREHKVKLAAVAGRKHLASSTSMSRALDDVEHRLLRPHVAWLLFEAVGVEPVLRHPAVQHYDALGQGWHVLDYDPTVTVLRQRALPSCLIPPTTPNAIPRRAPGTEREKSVRSVSHGSLREHRETRVTSVSQPV